MKKRDRFRLLLFPLVPFIFAVGWVLNVFGDHIKKWSFGEMWLAMEERESLRKLLLEKGFHLREES